MIGRNELAGYMMRRRARSRWDDEEEDLPPSFTLPSTPAATHTAPELESFLPAGVDQDWACKKCYVNDACMLYRKVGNYFSGGWFCFV